MTQEELLKIYFENTHVLQSKPWGEFKSLMGTRAVTIDKAQLTMHKIPVTSWKIGYLPKVGLADLNLEKLIEAGKRENIIFIKIDVPHAPATSQLSIVNSQLTPGKPVFAQSTLLLDLTKTDDELLSAMHEKTRYNIGLAKRKGVVIKVYENLEQDGAKEALENFVKLQEQTAARQKFFIHSENYYKNCFEILSRERMAHLVEAKVGEETAASWMLFKYGDIIYYPYGESNYKFRTFMPSNLVMWEAIQLGKKLGCKVFDLWGAAQNPEDEKDPWYGFTRFKMSFGATHITLSPTYDLVINNSLYSLFDTTNNIRWKLLKLVK